MYAKKANKTYQVETMQEMQNYLDRGFDIFNEQGEIVKHNPAKTIAYTEYQRLLDENRNLRAELSLLHAQLMQGVGAGPSTLAPADADIKTLAPPADDSTPRMGGRRAKAKAATNSQDGDNENQNGGAAADDQDGAADADDQNGDTDTASQGGDAE